MKKQNKRVLIFTLSGGGGHLQAAKAKYAELIDEGICYIIQKDTLVDFLGKYLGGLIVGFWNYCQRHGHIFSTLFFSFCSNFIDVVLTPLFFFKILFLLKKHKITHVIDTQHMATKPIVKAIRFLTFFYGNSIEYKKVLTDLPTKKCRHYFKSLLRLAPLDKPFIKIVTTVPLLEGYKDETEFWNKVTGLDPFNIEYSPFPLRPTFNSYKKKNTPLVLTFNTYSPESTLSICKAISYGNTPLTCDKNSLTFKAENQTLSLITLGSYPPKEVLINYMVQFIEQKKRYCAERKELLFILVGSEKTSSQYYKAILEELQTQKDYPHNLTILPLAFQDDTILAPLYFHIDCIIAKSGGLTTMELLQSVHGHIFIHDPQPPKLIDFLSHHTFDLMPPWERGNAHYLIEKKKAQMISPKLFTSVTSDFFLEPSNAFELNAK
jgi:hypothetical protein